MRGANSTWKTRNSLRKTKNLFPELKKGVMETITRLHTEDTNMKIYITACKYSFGEEVHMSPVEQTEIWEKHQRLTEQKIQQICGALKISVFGF